MQMERRFHPRKVIQTMVTLTIEAVTFELEAMNISLSGLQVESTESQIEQLTPHPIEGTIVMMTNKGFSVEVGCRIIMKRRLNQQQYILGLKFIELTSQQQCQLEEYIRGY